MANLHTGKRVVTGRQLLEFARGSAYNIAAWFAACLVLGAALWGLTLSKLEKDREALTNDALTHAASLSKSYASQLSRSIEQIDQITLHIRYYWKKTRGAFDLNEQVRAGLYPISAHLYVTIIDRNGNRVSSTIAGKIEGPNLAQRNFFQRHKSNPTEGLIISAPILGLRTGKTLTRFSRRLDTPDGKFDGVVVVEIEPTYLASFTDDASVGKNDFLLVRNTNGMVLASKMGENIRMLPDIFRSPPRFGFDHGVVTVPGSEFLDGQSHIVAWQELDSYPLVSIVGLSEQDIFSPYLKTERDYRNFAIVGSMVILLLTCIGILLTARMTIRKRQEQEVKDTYRLATDGAREGFYMARAMYDRANRVADFLIEDCNERGAAYYGTTRANLIGTRLSDLYSSPEHAQVVVGTYRKAMESGYHEDEIKVSPESSLKPTWIHRRLVRSGDGLAVALRDISDTKEQEEALSRMANADAVTTLPNRHWMMNYLPAAVENAKRGNTALALLFVDLDDFKNINDTLGHAAGDELLHAAGSRLRSVIRPQDNVVRLGGDEFTVILENIESIADVSRVAERIIKSLGEPFPLSDGDSHVVHASIGISMFPRDGGDGETLLKHADIAMYAAKANGKGYYMFYQPQLSERLVVRLNWEQALRKAIERDQFVLHYQPRVDTFSGELRSMEALVRWEHPERGLVPPLEFIQMAEDTGLIARLGEMVIEKAFAQLAQWKQQGLSVVPVSINVSPRQFNQGDVSGFLTYCLAHYDIDSSLIEIEVTESCMVAEDRNVTEQLAEIEALGFKLLVDDFGTGYSSLSQLQRLDMDVLKVDKAFTAQLCNGKEGEAFFMAILSMAHVLGMSVVAEGVETMEQLRVLQALSCNEIQGYLISRPVPAEEMAALMQKRFLFPFGRPSLVAV